MIKHTRHREQSCPKCGIKISAATEMFGEEVSPNEGDFSVCINCSSVLRYGENFLLSLSSVAIAENAEPGLGRQIEKAIAAIKQARKK